jgi:hypothetical protein
MAKDSASAVVLIGDVVSITVPTGHLDAGAIRLGMITDIQTPNADLVKVRVGWEVPMQNQLPTTAVSRLDPQLDYDWFNSNVTTKKN